MNKETIKILSIRDALETFVQCTNCNEEHAIFYMHEGLCPMCSQQKDSEPSITHCMNCNDILVDSNEELCPTCNIPPNYTKDCVECGTSFTTIHETETRCMTCFLVFMGEMKR